MSDPFDLSGRAILVTGASSGIGADVAAAIAERRGRVVVHGRNETRLQGTLERLPGEGHRSVAGTLEGLASGEALVDRVVAEVGPLAGVVHCAGVMLNRPLRFLTEAEWDQTFRVNVQSAVGMLKAWRKRGQHVPGGSTVWVASVMGHVGQAGLGGYCASKGALVAAAKSLALELARESLRVNCVAPAMVETELMREHFAKLSADQVSAIRAQHPLGLGTPRDVANAVVFLLSDAARWVTGTSLLVDGGYTAQ